MNVIKNIITKRESEDDEKAKGQEKPLKVILCISNVVLGSTHS